MSRAMDEIRIQERLEGFVEGFKKGFTESFVESFKEAFIKNFRETFEKDFEEKIKRFVEESDLVYILNLVENTGWSTEMAMDMLEIPEERRERYQSILENW